METLSIQEYLDIKRREDSFWDHVKVGLTPPYDEPSHHELTLAKLFEKSHRHQAHQLAQEFAKQLARSDSHVKGLVKHQIASLEQKLRNLQADTAEQIKENPQDKELLIDFFRAKQKELKKKIHASKILLKPDEDTDYRLLQKIERARSSSLSELLQASRPLISCPFHEDKTPSAYIYEDKRLHCFSCGYHGDQIDVAMRLHNYAFKEAVEYLCSGI